MWFTLGIKSTEPGIKLISSGACCTIYWVCCIGKGTQSFTPSGSSPYKGRQSHSIVGVRTECDNAYKMFIPHLVDNEEWVSG